MARTTAAAPVKSVETRVTFEISRGGGGVEKGDRRRSARDGWRVGTRPRVAAAWPPRVAGQLLSVVTVGAGVHGTRDSGTGAVRGRAPM